MKGNFRFGTGYSLLLIQLGFLVPAIFCPGSNILFLIIPRPLDSFHVLMPFHLPRFPCFSENTVYAKLEVTCVKVHKRIYSLAKETGLAMI